MQGKYFILAMPSSHHSSSMRQQRAPHKPFTVGGGRYVCQRNVGSGTYGRVVQCIDQQTNKVVAVKISKKDPAYTRAANVEYNTLLSLQKKTIYSAQTFDKFEESGHTCIVMEYLSENLFEVGRKRFESKGEMLHLDELRQILHCVLVAIRELHRMNLMHCDIKPENIMFRSIKRNQSLSSRGFLFPFVNTPNNPNNGQMSAQHLEQPSTGRDSPSPSPCSPVWVCGSGVGTTASGNHDGENPLNSFSSLREESGDSSTNGDEKTIDFTNACLIDYGAVRHLEDNAYFHIQSMWYRAPEVLCNVKYTPKIDSWSMGCLLFETYTGIPLFAGNNTDEQLKLIIDVVGSFPHLRSWNPKLAVGLSEHSHDQIVEILRSRAETARRLKSRNKVHPSDMNGKFGSSVSVNSRSVSGSTGFYPGQEVVDTTPSSSTHSRPSVIGSGTLSSSSENTTPNSTIFLSDLRWSPSPLTSDADSGAFGEVERYAECLYLDLMGKLLSPDENRRLSCEKALEHPFFTAFSASNAVMSRSGSGVCWCGSPHQRHHPFPSTGHLGGSGDSSRCCSNSGTLGSASMGGLGGVLSRAAPSFSSRGGGDGLSSSPSLLLSEHNSTSGVTTVSSFNPLPGSVGPVAVSQVPQGFQLPPSACSVQQLQQAVLVPTQFSQDVVGGWVVYPSYSQGVKDPPITSSGIHPIPLSGTRGNGTCPLSLSTPTRSEVAGRSTTEGNSSSTFATNFSPTEPSSTFLSTTGGSATVAVSPTSVVVGDNENGVLGVRGSESGGKGQTAFAPVGAMPPQENNGVPVLPHGCNRDGMCSSRGGAYSGSGSSSRSVLSQPVVSSGGCNGAGNRTLSTTVEHQQKQQPPRLYSGLWNDPSIPPVGNAGKSGYLDSCQSCSPLMPSPSVTVSNRKGQLVFPSSNKNGSSSSFLLPRR